MKLLIFISSLSSGGAERVTTNLANHWSAKGWDVTIATLASHRDDFYELHPLVKRISLELDGDSSNIFVAIIRNIRRIFALRQLLRQTQPDIAMGMMTGANVLLALAAYGLRQIRTIGSERTYPPSCPLGIVWEWLRRRSYGHLDAVIAQTSEGADWLKLNTTSKRVEVIPNPVNWPMTDQLPKVDIEKVISTGRYLLLAVGRLSGEKQFDILIECFRTLAQQYPNWDLVILGEGPLRSVLEEQVRASDLERRVVLPGRVGNMASWYEKADIYVLSSLFEGFPNTLLEAMASGVPAVSIDCDTGPRDIIRHEVDGLLVPREENNGLAFAMERLMKDGALRQSLAERTIDVREFFAMEQIANKWQKIFLEVRND